MNRKKILASIALFFILSNLWTGFFVNQTYAVWYDDTNYTTYQGWCSMVTNGSFEGDLNWWTVSGWDVWTSNSPPIWTYYAYTWTSETIYQDLSVVAWNTYTLRFYDWVHTYVDQAVTLEFLDSWDAVITWSHNKTSPTTFVVDNSDGNKLSDEKTLVATAPAWAVKARIKISSNGWNFIKIDWVSFYDNTDPDCPWYVAPQASIWDIVWFDTDRNGIQDIWENWVSGIWVELFNSSNVSQATTTTSSTWSYNFTGLTPWDYYVQFTIDAPYIITWQDQGWNDALDSDINTTTKRTINTTLVAWENDLSWDAWVYTEIASIWNFVWNDINADWIQDIWELWIDWVTVRLYKSDNTLVETQTTASWWLYHFVNKPIWDYYVEFSNLPAWYTVSPRNQGWNTATDSDVNSATFITDTTTLVDGEDDLSWDMWIYQSASIWDKVWFDTDRDGIQDVWENWIANIWVELFDSLNVIKWTWATDASWIYSFVWLIPWDYYVKFILNAPYIITWQDLGWNDVLDSDINSTTKRTITTTLIAWENDISWDAWVYIPYASIWNYVWSDTNADWIQDIWESWIANVVVKLISSTWAELSSTTTSSTWAYLFDNLAPWDYSIEVVKPTWYSFSPQNTTWTWTDSDVDISTWKTINTTLSNDENDMSWDAWVYESASIWDRVWLDKNADWIQDVWEIWIENIEVRLLNSSGAVVSTGSTDINWDYNFENLVPWDYEIEFVKPTNYEVSPKNSGTNINVDSNADLASNFKTGLTTLVGWENDLSWDLGLYELASIWDRVWLDKNANWIQDVWEIWIENVEVQLLNSSSIIVSTGSTNASWAYLFDNLIPQDYSIKIITPNWYEISPQDSWTDDTIDSDINSTTWKTQITDLESWENDMTWDAWIYELASIWNYVWLDENANWIQDVSENWIANVEVQLLNISSVIVSTGSTNASWAYLFDNLVPQNYFIKIITPNWYVISPQDSWTDDTIDSDINSTTWETQITDLESWENDMTWDAWIYELASIWNYVWSDTNADWIQDIWESWIANVVVKLISSTWAELSSTTTSSTWAYLFDNLAPWDYSIEVVKPTWYSFSPQNTTWTWTDSDVDISTWKTINTTLSNDENDMSWDAWVYESASIWDRVWLDKNADWIQDVWEIWIENIEIRLLNSSGAVVSTGSTDVNWDYNFENLVPWDYEIEFVKPTNYEVSPKNSGTNINVDSDADLASNFKTGLTTLVGWENDLSWDLGLYEFASVWNIVWLDKNANWIQDIWETWVANVVVKLLSSTWAELSTTTTSTGWLYKFENLIPADYTIEVIKPTWYEISFQDIWSDIWDSDIDLVTWKTININLESWEYDPTWDAWIYELASIWNIVWLDENADWIQNTWEIRVANVTINLLSSIWTVLQTTTTNTGWLYKFENLIPDPYRIELVVPTWYEISYQDIWTDDAIDSDINLVSKQTIITELESWEDDITWDAWIYEFASLWDRVWHDLNANWIQDSWEVWVENVVVNLLDKNSNQIATTTTGSGGIYSFGDLIPEEYKVQIIVPNNYFLSPKDSTTNNDIDSDIDPITGISEDKILISNEDYLGLDAWIYMKVELWNYVWHDENKDGIQDIWEDPIENAIVKLFDNNGNFLADTTTNTGWLYLFQDLIPSEYIVLFQAPIVSNINYNTVSPKNKWTDDLKDSNIDLSTRKSDTIILVSGIDDYSIDAWFYEEYLGLWTSSKKKKPKPKSEPIKKIIKKEEPKTEELKEEKIIEEPKIEVIKKEIIKKLEKIRDFTPEYITYINKKRKLEKIIEEEWTIWVWLKYFPKVLPKTWTPISQRIKTIKQKRINTTLPDSNIFRLAWNYINNIEYWKQVLPKQDQNRDEYIVVPSNWLVIPINHVPSNTIDFTKMISWKEIHVNDYLKTWAMMYPNSSINEYGKPWNKVVFWHSSYWKKDDWRYQTHFQKIIELDEAEEVWVFKKINGKFKRFRYKIEKSYNTPQENVSVLKPWVWSILTLFTCTPIWWIKWRWIIEAKYINEEKQKLIEEVTDFGISSKQLRLVNKMIYILNKLEKETKKRKISTFYTNIERLEKNNISYKNKNFFRYLKIRLLKEFFN